MILEKFSVLNLINYFAISGDSKEKKKQKNAHLGRCAPPNTTTTCVGHFASKNPTLEYEVLPDSIVVDSNQPGRSAQPESTVVSQA